MKSTLLVSAAALAFSAGFYSLPVLAATSDDLRPPEISLVQPATFTVNHLITIQATVSSTVAISSCYLFLDDKNAGRMDIRNGVATLQRVFFTAETHDANVKCDDSTGQVGIGATRAILADKGDTPTPGYLPNGFTDEQLLQATCLPGDWHGDYCQNVYLIKNGQRHAFQSNAAFTSWYPSSPTILHVSIDALSSVSLGSLISVKPGSGRVRFLSQSQVYQVLDAGHLHKELVSTPNEPIDVLTDAFFSQFAIDPDMNPSAESRA
jgi:hypothetical protein